MSKDDTPDDLVLAVDEIPDDLRREQLPIRRLPANWGDLAPSEHNCLINPKHGDPGRMVQRGIEPLSCHLRMFPKRHARRKRRRQ
jgi:hypothetical protein